MRVDVEEIKRIAKERKQINDLNFDEIEWYENGKLLNITDKMKDDWSFIGLINEDFITSGYYLDE